ncbi:YcaO-like family protein [Peribacillus sp. SCS-26]|uniref:YcaO-like family protein n=1 Tax=Paraperibacillus marinus TaxID=3115295 RepID=UPI0039069554
MKIFHKLGREINFNLPNDIFINKSIHLLYSSHGNFLLNSKVGPDTGFSVGLRKRDSILRAFAEVLERRGTMLGGKKINPTTLVKTWELKEGKESKIDYEFTTFSDNSIDTTGCAAHTDPQKAIYNALKEIYEKNSLYLFWYGMDGLKINLDFYKDNVYYQCLKASGFEINIFVNKFFSPLKIIIALAFKENDIMVCGLGSSLSYSDSINHALEEAFSMAAFHYYYLLFGNKGNRNLMLSTEKIQHVKKLMTLEEAEINWQDYNYVPSQTVKTLINCSPEYIKEIHVIQIEQHIYPKLQCIRVYAKGLLNCLPLKKNIELDSLFNQKTIVLTKDKFDSIPECPMS